MEQVIELCRHCGFEIPADAPACQSRPTRSTGPTAGLVARRVAGVALATRSVHPLGALAPQRADDRIDPPAAGARAAFGVGAGLVTVALAGIALSWLLHREPFVLSVPDSLDGWIHTITRWATVAAVAAVALGLAALVWRGGRHVALRTVHLVVEHGPAVIDLRDPPLRSR